MLKDGVKARWTVESMDFARRMQGIEYTVTMLEDGKTYHCTCDAFKFGQGIACKHIEYVKRNRLEPDETRETDILPMLRDALMGSGNVTVEIKNDGRGGKIVKIIR